MRLKQKRIVALGDSITYGYPYTSDESWVNYLKKSGIDIINSGVNGDTLEGMLDRFDEDVVSYSPKFVIIMGGTNDAFGQYPLAAMEYNLRQIVDKSFESNIAPIIGIPVPTDESMIELKLEKFRHFLRKFCSEKIIPYIDFYSAVVDNTGSMKSEFDFDGVHPNKCGYFIMGKVAKKFINGFLKIEI